MKTSNDGFTRLELFFAVLASALVALPAISLLASSQSESQRIVCFNNLRQVTRAFRSWANDHGDVFAWYVPLVPDGGTQNHSLAGNTWFQLVVLSNHLSSPRQLVCPADAGTPRIADNWGSGPDGFLNTGNRNNANSYIIALHAREYLNNSLLSGDRNIRVSTIGSSCSFLPLPVCAQLAPQDSIVGWTNAIHGKRGHLALADGSVFFSNSQDLRTLVNQGNDDNNSGIHFITK